MSREILVVTPENIEIEYELAGIGTRFAANLVDTLLQVVIYAAVLIPIGVLDWAISLSFPRSAGELQELISAFGESAATILGFIILYGYYIYYEIRWNGQTPGKRQFGLRVIRDGGYPITPFGAISRNLIRLVEANPLITLVLIASSFVPSHANWIGAVGGLTILIPLTCVTISSRYQRLGDFVAGTMVVKQRAPMVLTLDALAPAPRVLPEHLAPYALTDIGRHVAEMTVPEYRAVRHFVDRRWQLDTRLQQLSAMRLAIPLMSRLEISPPPGTTQVDYANFLEYLMVAFEQYRGVK